MWSSSEEQIQTLPHPLIEIIIEAVKMDKIIEKKSSVHHAFTKIEGKLDSWRYLWEREYITGPPLMSSGVVTRCLLVLFLKMRLNNSLET